MEVPKMNGVDAVGRDDIAESKHSSSNEVSAGVSAEASAIDRIAEDLPLICPGYLPPRVRRAIELTHCLEGPQLERAIEEVMAS